MFNERMFQNDNTDQLLKFLSQPYFPYKALPDLKNRVKELWNALNGDNENEEQRAERDAELKKINYINCILEDVKEEWRKRKKELGKENWLSSRQYKYDGQLVSVKDPIITLEHDDVFWNEITKYLNFYERMLLRSVSKHFKQKIDELYINELFIFDKEKRIAFRTRDINSSQPFSYKKLVEALNNQDQTQRNTALTQIKGAESRENRRMIEQAIRGRNHWSMLLIIIAATSIICAGVYFSLVNHPDESLALHLFESMAIVVFPWLIPIILCLGFFSLKNSSTEKYAQSLSFFSPKESLPDKVVVESLEGEEELKVGLINKR